MKYYKIPRVQRKFRTINELPNKYKKRLRTGRWDIIKKNDFITGIIRKTKKEKIYF